MGWDGWVFARNHMYPMGGDKNLLRDFRALASLLLLPFASLSCVLASALTTASERCRSAYVRGKTEAEGKAEGKAKGKAEGKAKVKAEGKAKAEADAAALDAMPWKVALPKTMS